MSRYRRAPISGATYFFTLNTYRRQALLTHAEVMAALRLAHRAVRELLTHSESMPWWSCPIIFMRCEACLQKTPIIQPG